ncbi:MAG: WYL domain-containing protein, partial [Paludibacteraceae bacterium]|nr:WYL domain-containing protein [Paludibacteraceae bacterium]
RGYVRTLPLHHSQKEVETTDEYSIFEYYMVPKWNFMMELLSMEDAVEVLEPQHFRELVANQIKDMYRVYYPNKI